MKHSNRSLLAHEYHFGPQKHLPPFLQHSCLFCHYLTTMALQKFHRFCQLPRELQLHIWEYHELLLPLRRHYFRRMVVWRGLLYACADQETSRLVNNIAKPEGRDETEVPDPAITPDTKIKLDGTTNCLSRNSPAAVASFSKIQLSITLPSPASVWVNLKRDTFCFVHKSHNSRPGDVLQYLSGANGLAWPHPNSGGVLPSSHWFFRIRNLSLIAPFTGKHLDTGTGLPWLVIQVSRV